MYNDFVIVGPRSDPAGLAGGGDAAEALRALARAEAVFVSRGDDSGTHKAERRLWAAAGIEPGGAWYRETGSGMGATLNIAAGMGAYALSDRASWIDFGNKGDLEIGVEGDPRLFNQYGVIAVNPERFPHAKAREGRLFVDWLLSAAGQDAIASFRLDGRQLFFPNAAPPAPSAPALSPTSPRRAMSQPPGRRARSAKRGSRAKALPGMRGTGRWRHRLPAKIVGRIRSWIWRASMDKRKPVWGSGGTVRHCVRVGESPVGVRRAFPRGVTLGGRRRWSML